MHHHTHGFVEAVEAGRARDFERALLAPSGGDRITLAEIVTRFAARIRSVARQHRLAKQDVDDVMQTTWLRLVEHADAIRDPSSIGAWLETTARRESLRVLREAGREIPTDDQLLPHEHEPPVDEQRLAAAERQAAMAAALADLRGRQRELLAVLLVDPPPSYDEISRVLGMPVGSIGPTRARIIEQLRGCPHLADLGSRS